MSIFAVEDMYYDNAHHILKKNCEFKINADDIFVKFKRTKFITGCYLILTNSCNLNCVYCFAKKNRKHDRLSLDTVQPLIFEIIKNSILCRSLGNVNVIPYIKFSGGGEPTLNFEVMQQITSFTNSLLRNNDLLAEYHLATNGQWNRREQSEWINENITNLLFSVDGTDVVNNTHRPRIDRGNSYVILLNNLKQITNSKIKITFRMTVSNYSLPYLEESISSFRSLGINNVQIEPLMPFEVKKDIFEPDPGAFAKQYSYVKYRYSDINIFSSFDVFDQKDNHPCGHQTGNIVSLFPDGTISSCPERSTSHCEEEYIRGKVENGRMLITELTDSQMHSHFDRCKDCIVSSKCDLCVSKVKLFRDKNYDTEYLCKIYRDIFVESIHHLVHEKSINQNYSFAYDINSSKYIFRKKDIN